MKLSEEILEQYAKKILGFAYEKTGNAYEAEDLAQEIMVQLASCIRKGTEAEYVSSFIYTVCCHVWSKYLRKSKKHAGMVGIDEAEEVADALNVEEDVENRLLCARLRGHISALAKTRREIILLHYYENKTTAEISEILHMNSNTVRWYLGNIRESLKEKINMSEMNLDLRPVSIWVGIDGHSESSEVNDIFDDLLAQNIAIACYGEPLTISEISERLHVAAAYLERHIERMVYMDFLKRNGKKYQTNFFIQTDKIMAAEVNFGYEHGKDHADRLYNAVMARKEELLSVDYLNKEDVDKDDFLWFILLKTAQELSYGVKFPLWEKLGITERPMRKDGSDFWVIAGIRYEKMEGLDEERQAYADYRHCSGYKENRLDYATLYQDDTYFLLQNGTSNRNTSSNDNLFKLSQIVLALRDRVYGRAGESTEELTEHEKYILAEFVKEGLISVENKMPVIHIPVLTEAQMEEITGIVEKIKDDLGRDFFEDYIMDYGKMMDSLIPSFLDKNVRNYHKYASLDAFDIFGWLIKEAKEGGNCKLAIPDGQAAKYALTWLVLKNR